MPVDLSQIRTQTIEAGLSHVVDRIVRQYETFPLAFQKEAIQNAWDARLNKDTADNWIVKFGSLKLNGLSHILIEDTGTKGMNKEGWDAFTALWKPNKEQEDAGGQGQGKFVLMKASNDHILLVESNDGFEYQCRFLQDDQKDTQEVKYKIDDLLGGAIPISHKGTKIWVYNADPKFLETIQTREFTDDVTATWWEALQGRLQGKIIFFGKQLIFPDLPRVTKSKICLENEKVKNFGRIKRLVLELYEKDLLNGFSGVRVQRSQMMVTTIPFETNDKEYENRLSGYITFDRDLERRLKEIERTDHCGFVWESPWKEIKKLIEDEVIKFKDEVLPKNYKEEKFNQRTVDEVISRSNQIISDYLPEVNRTPGGKIPPIPRKDKLEFRIDNLFTDRKEIKFNETVHSKCTIRNESGNFKEAIVRYELKHEGEIVDRANYSFKVRSKESKPLFFPELRCDSTWRKGKYTIRVTLESNRHDVDSKATSFYLESKRPRLKNGFVKRINFGFHKDPTKRNEKISDGSITIYLSHPDYRNIDKSFKNQPVIKNNQIKFYLIKIVIDEAIRYYLKERLKTLDESSVEIVEDEVDEIANIRDNMYHDVYAK